MLPSMPCRILPLLLLSLLALAPAVQARVLEASMDKVSTGVATLHGVSVRLDWPANAGQGQLRLTASQIVAPELGYRFQHVAWECPLRRGAAGQDWICEGEVHSAGRKPAKLAVDLATASTDAVLSQGKARLSLHRNAAAPDITRIDLVRVPVAWSQALLAQAWPAANLKGGHLAGSLDIEASDPRPLRVAGHLSVAQLALDTPDGTTAAEGVDGRFALDFRKSPGLSLVTVEGALLGGEILAGNAYLALPATPIVLNLAARQQGGAGWEIPQLLWDDGEALRVEGSLGFTGDASLRDAEIALHSGNIAPLRSRYLSGWLGLLGLGELELRGAFSAHLAMQGGEVVAAEAQLDEIAVRDAQQRFGFEGLGGKPVYSATTPVKSELHWRGGALQGLAFGKADLPLYSSGGTIGLSQPVTVPMLGGGLHFENLNLRPATSAHGMEFDFGLTLQALDVGQLAKALDWPPFQGQLDGRIPKVRYANDRLDFDGALTAQVFEGTVLVSGLSMERPFGTAPTLSADIVLDNLDLQSLTEVFGFGEITGALDGSIRQLRLVDWSPQSFNADLHTDPTWKGRQRISQRAVQDLSSVGGNAGGLGNSLQAQALKLFDDFGYRQIGISCRLAEEICEMDGLSSAANRFIIVQGSGLPRLGVVGFNRRVDWPTLVQRLVDATRGDSKPVFE